MIYLTASILGSHPEAHRTRAYVYSLSRTGLPIWAIWKDSTPVQPGILDPNFQSILQLASAADGHSPEPCHAIIRMGSVMDCITQRAANRAPFEVAFTDWWSDVLPPRLARRLAEFDEVWVKSEAEGKVVRTAFGAIDAKTPVRVYLLPTADLGLTRVRPCEETDEAVVVAVGDWEGWGNTREAFHAFALAEAEARLLLVCPNVPFATREELTAYCDKEGLPIPTVSTVREYPRRWDELCGLIAMGKIFLDTSRRACADWLSDIAADGLGVLSWRNVTLAPVESGFAPYVAPQQWSKSNVESLSKMLNKYATKSRMGKDGLGWKRLRKPPREIKEAMQGWDVSRAPAAPKEVAANPNAVVPPTLLVVVPFRNRPTEGLEATLRSIATQLGPMDEVIVSDQGSDDPTFARVEALCRQYGASLVSEEVFGEAEWNIARARNVGLRQAVESTDWVMCVDADVVLSPGFVQELKLAIMRDGGQGYAPIIDEVASVGSGWANREPKEILGGRIASGCAALPRALVEQAHGWDEEYCGYGSEDIDLFLRLRHTGFEVVPWECPTGKPQHQAHAPSEVKQEAGQRSLERVGQRMRGELGWTANGSGWGDGGVRCLARGGD